jgi:hypothetical protein
MIYYHLVFSEAILIFPLVLQLIRANHGWFIPAVLSGCPSAHER